MNYLLTIVEVVLRSQVVGVRVPVYRPIFRFVPYQTAE